MHDKIKKPKKTPTQKGTFHTDQNPHNQIQNITYKIKNSTLKLPKLRQEEKKKPIK